MDSCNMKLSSLQRHILKQCFKSPNFKVSKKIIESFYSSKTVKPKSIIDDITKSIDRMIKKELIVGYGIKTAHKWFIKEVKLTLKGKKMYRSIFTQQKLPFKKS